MAFFKRLLGLKSVPKEDSKVKEFYDDMTIDIFARTLWWEARSEGIEGIEAVACVILNRVRISKLFNGYWWGNDIIQVCQKPYQFSCWLKSDPQFQRVISVNDKDPYFLTCKRVARRAVLGLLSDKTRRATHYHADYVTPSWAKPSAETMRIGCHIFYKLIDV